MKCRASLSFFFIRLFVSQNDAAFALCFIYEHCVFGQVRVSFELLNRPFWSNLDPKPCCEELLGCSRDLWGDKLLNSGPLEAQGAMSQPPVYVSRSIVESFVEYFFDLEAALGIVFRILVSM